MNYTTTKNYQGMGDFLARKYNDGSIVESDGHRDPETGAYFARFGRRVIVDEGYGVEYERFDTKSEACNYVAELHDARGPVWDWDGIVAEGRSSYFVSMEGVRVGDFDTEDEAVYALAEAMVDAGCFPDAFFVNERGNFHRIDADVRALHDDGGDKMREAVA